ncbi:MAG: hypothetical protein OXU73_02025 [Candidatus Campbellbacteria bacterium]|nr:hypothetical protein [Candidatus Campbellbacteria bacterium]
MKDPYDDFKFGLVIVIIIFALIWFLSILFGWPIPRDEIFEFVIGIIVFACFAWLAIAMNIPR